MARDDDEGLSIFDTETEAAPAAPEDQDTTQELPAAQSQPQPATRLRTGAPAPLPTLAALPATAGGPPIPPTGGAPTFPVARRNGYDREAVDGHLRRQDQALGALSAELGSAR